MSNSQPKDDSSWTDELNLDESALQSLLDNPLQQDHSQLRQGEKHHGFDSNVGETWIYPSNMPCRSYQLNIAQAALYRNTLVVLPTGLGKTFIAAVLMYNIYRWYPRGKVIFMAPTRPLVNQQIEACQKIMPFPLRDTVELTGKIPKAKRLEFWKTKRVFFATPQVVQSDIFTARNESSIDANYSTTYNTEFPFEQIKLLVIDEAHKAKGKYAYTEVTQAIAQNQKYFRVLALSATPGRTMEDVAEVCRNLFIAHIEVRCDQSIDVVSYVHKRSMETIVVTLGETIKDMHEQLLQIIDPYLRQLIEADVLSGSLTSINRNFLLYEQKRYRDRSFHNGRHPQHAAIASNFAVCISLFHALELLERHGLRVFLQNFEDDEDGKSKFVLQMDGRLRDMVESLREKLGPNPFNVSAAPMTNGKIAEIPKDLDFGHPKFEKARECLLKHFADNEESRAIVFCEYRESVMLIYRMLLQHVPLLRPRCFVGQGGTGSLRALTQKQQIQIMNDFRSGKSNILIATSIGEEGIDVGEVDLIVCFDISTSNPTRFVQRIGRTGRKKNGKVIMLVTEGREQQLLREVLVNKDQTNKKITKSTVVQHSLYKNCPRMVPTEYKPKCVHTFIKPCEEDDEEEELDKNVKTNKKLKNKKPTTSKQSNQQHVKGTQDLRKFFNPKPKLSAEDLEFFELDTKISQAKPGTQTQQQMRNSLHSMRNLFKDLESPVATQTQRAVCSKKSAETNTKHQTLHEDDVIDLSDEQVECLPSSSFNVTPLHNSAKNQPVRNVDFSIPALDFNKTELKPKTPDPNRIKEINRFLKSKLLSSELLKRSKLNLEQQLKSPEVSDEMKKLMLKLQPEFIKENLAQMLVLQAMGDEFTVEAASVEEKSIRDVNKIILRLFQGLSKVESFLEELELAKYKQKCLESETYQQTEDNDDDDNENKNDKFKFCNKLDNIFKGLEEKTAATEASGSNKKHICDNYDWMQTKLQEIYKNKQLLDATTNQMPQQSMVYNTMMVDSNDNEIDYTIHKTGQHSDDDNVDQYSFTESKYCSQFAEFHSKVDAASKSTPITKAFQKRNLINKTCATPLLGKLEEIHEEQEQQDDEDNDLADMLKAADEAELQESLKSQKVEYSQEAAAGEEKNIYKNSANTEELELELLAAATELEKEHSLRAELKPCTSKSLSPSSLPALQNSDEEDLEFFTAAAEAERKPFSACKVVSSNTSSTGAHLQHLKNNDFEHLAVIELKPFNSFKALGSCTSTPSSSPSQQRLKREQCLKPETMRCTSTPSSSKIAQSLQHNSDEEDFELLVAAAEAELQFTQNQTKEKTSDKTSPPSLNSTPDLLDLCKTYEAKANEPLKPAIKVHCPQDDMLDFDMNAFLEPFPQEEELIKSQIARKTVLETASPANNPSTSRRNSTKENHLSGLSRCSPDLFAEDNCHKSPTIKKSASLTLAGKLAAKLNKAQSCQMFPTATAATFKSPVLNAHNTVSSTATAEPLLPLCSPTSRLKTQKLKANKSPSIFDAYANRSKIKLKYPKIKGNDSSVMSSSSFSSSAVQCSTPSNNLSTKELSHFNKPDEESIIVLRKSGGSGKRKIFDSESEDSDSEENIRAKNVNGINKLHDSADDTDSDEVAATQKPSVESPVVRQLKKRSRFNSFIEQEAMISGSDHSEDEGEHTLGYYQYDSVVVASDDDDEDQASTMTMQCMYLQSLKSPIQRRGAFKMPAPRVYNDHSRIFSQAIVPEDDSYLPNSFIVDENDSQLARATDVSMCPLEKAEKILKERRRAKKRQYAQIAEVSKLPNNKRKKKTYLLEDSTISSDE